MSPKELAEKAKGDNAKDLFKNRMRIPTLENESRMKGSKSFRITGKGEIVYFLRNEG